MKIITVDGLPVNAADPAAAEATITKLIGDRATAQADAQDAKAKLETANTTVAARDAEIVGLKEQVTAAQLTPAALRDAARSYAVTAANAKLLGATVTDAMDEAEMKAAAVKHKMGDAAAAYEPAQVETAFGVLVAQLGDKAANPATGAPVADALRDVITATPISAGDAETAATTARDARLERFRTAHRGPAPAGS